MSRIVSIIATILLLLVIGGVAWAFIDVSSNLFGSVSPSPTPTISPADAVQRTLTGELDCLPQLNEVEGQPLGCRLGLDTEEGFYAMDVTEDVVGEMLAGEEVRVKGLVVSKKELDESDSLKQYDIVGLIEVTSIEELDEQARIENGLVSLDQVVLHAPVRYSITSEWLEEWDDLAIPPCDRGFDYCIYLSEEQLGDTLFLSASVRLQKRPDVGNEEACVSVFPNFTNQPERDVVQYSTHTICILQTVQETKEELNKQASWYRAFLEDNCYEFETRLVWQQEDDELVQAQTFERSDKNRLVQELRGIVRTTRFMDGQIEVFKKVNI